MLLIMYSGLQKENEFVFSVPTHDRYCTVGKKDSFPEGNYDRYCGLAVLFVKAAE